MVSNWLTGVNGGRRNPKMRKTGFAKRSRFSSNADMGEFLLAVLLDAGGAQASQTMLIDRELPGEEFVHGQRVAAAGLLKGKQATANGSDNFSLAANDPPLGAGRGQIRNRQRTAVRPDDVFDPRAMGFCHGVLTNSQPLNSQCERYAEPLKICLSPRLQYESPCKYRKARLPDQGLAG
jgi:hypothetical protein